jgi:protein-L-isoaspartate(D-aspartate) O-methyltransferase
MSDPVEDRNAMVERQIARRGVTNPVILNAFRTVPRDAFVPEAMREFAYSDSPLPIAESQTISQPYIVASMIDAAEVGPGHRVLEVGAGSGYAAAVLSRIAAEVFAIERYESLAREAAERVRKLGYGNCSIVAGDGMAGLPPEAPFDAILVAARSETVPAALKQQLKVGGRLVIPVGGEDVQQLRCIVRREEDRWETHDIAPVRFVPLLPGAVPENGARQ